MNIETTAQGGFLYEVEHFRPPAWMTDAIERNPDHLDSLLSLISPIDVETIHNILPTEGLNHLLSVAFNGGSQTGTWYLGLFEGNYTPVLADTMAAFPAAATESTAYSESVRQTWNESTPAAGSTTNSANKAAFSINATKTIYGAFLSSSSVKGGTTGILVSAARFATSKAVENGDILRVTASISLTSS